MNRRQFLKTTAAALAATAVPVLPIIAATPPPTVARLPRWHGFNLTEKFVARRDGNPPFADSDFALLAEWGFDFTRLPMSYHCWASPDEPLKLREAELKHLEQAVESG